MAVRLVAEVHTSLPDGVAVVDAIGAVGEERLFRRGRGLLPNRFGVSGTLEDELDLIAQFVAEGRLEEESYLSKWEGCIPADVIGSVAHDKHLYQ